MNKVLLNILLILISNCSFSQIATEVNTGRPFQEIKNTEVYGSPYLFDSWKSGSVTLENGNTVTDLPLKFDILNNKFLYQQHDTTFEFVSDVREIKIKDAGEKEGNTELIFEKVITANDKISQGTFVQILSSGKITLLKYFSKRIEGENTTNGMFSSKKEIVSHNSYWATLNNETILVKLNKQSLEELTLDKKDKVQVFVETEKLNVKKEKDFAAAITYYNSITTP